MRERGAMSARREGAYECERGGTVSAREGEDRT